MKKVYLAIILPVLEKNLNKKKFFLKKLINFQLGNILSTYRIWFL